MNLVVIVGNVGRDPELRHTQSGKAVANFSVATSERNGETQWFNVTVWDKQAELSAQYVKKGDRIAVTGRMRSRDHDGKTYWDLIADRVEFGAKRDDRADNEPPRATPEPARQQHTKARWDDSEIPF